MSNFSNIYSAIKKKEKDFMQTIENFDLLFLKHKSFYLKNRSNKLSNKLKLNSLIDVIQNFLKKFSNFFSKLKLKLSVKILDSMIALDSFEKFIIMNETKCGEDKKF